MCMTYRKYLNDAFEYLPKVEPSRRSLLILVITSVAADMYTGRELHLEIIMIFLQLSQPH